jgi:N-formylglutamate amidohydrolase
LSSFPHFFKGETNYDFFNGGYTVRRFGSKRPEDTVDAIQMETPYEVGSSEGSF